MPAQPRPADAGEIWTELRKQPRHIGAHSWVASGGGAALPPWGWYVEHIPRATVYDVARVTALSEMPRLSERLGHGNLILAKREDTQREVFSFKLRGAYNFMAALPPDLRARGVVTASAGNHAQGVALSARALGTRAEVFMPARTPRIKLDAVGRLGGAVECAGADFEETLRLALRRAAARGMAFVPPFDHPLVIAGQGTVGAEIAAQLRGRACDALFVPVGGGGLIAGVAAWIRHVRPDIRVVGVQPAGCDALRRSLRAGTREALREARSLADGVAVRAVGAAPWSLCAELVDHVEVVSEEEICAAIADVYDDFRSVVEPAGALAVAGAKKFSARGLCRGARLVAVTSGANMDFHDLARVAAAAAPAAAPTPRAAQGGVGAEVVSFWF